MPFFSYRAVDGSGHVIKGSIEKDNAEQVRLYLKSLSLIEIDIRKMSLLNIDLESIGVLRRRFSKRETAFVCRQMTYILNSGLNTAAGFDVLIGNSLNPRMKRCFAGMKPDVLAGLSMYHCFRKAEVFPKLLVNMINVGEESDRLREILKNMSDFYDRDAKVSDQMAAAMLYPIFIAGTMIVVVIAALVYVIPAYSSMFLYAGESLPLPTRILMAMSDFFIGNRAEVTVTGVAVMISAVIFFRTALGGFVADRIKLMKLFGGKYSVTKLNLYYALTMSIMLSSNAGITASLETAREVTDNRVFTRQIDLSIDRIRKGAKLSQAVSDSRLYDKMLVSMIKLGEETDRLPAALSDCAKYLEEELDISLNKLKELIQPISTVALGLILAFIILATMLPSVQMTSFF